MEKKLEKMREDIRARLMRTRGFVACIVILLGVVASGVLPYHGGKENAADFMEGFQMGALCGIALVAIVTLVRYEQALKSDAKLKEIYYKENDERTNYIAMMAGKNSMRITLAILLIAAVIVGYYSFEAFAALVGAAVVESLVMLGFKLYYSRTFSGVEE